MVTNVSSGGVFGADLNQLVAHYPQRHALIDAVHEQRHSYQGLAILIQRLQATLESWQIGAGEVVVSLLPNSVEQLSLFLAALYSGRHFAPLSPQCTAIELAHWLKVTQAKVCLLTTLSSPAQQQAVREAGVTLQLVALDGQFEWAQTEQRSVKAEPQGGSRLYLHTSGTKGEPKALVIDANTLWQAGQAFVALHPALHGGMRFFNIMPMSYLGGLFNLGLIPLVHGGSIVVAPPFSGRTLMTFWHDVKRFGVEALWLVPTVARGLLALYRPGKDERTTPRQTGIQYAFVGTAAITPEEKQRFEACFGIPLLENYGLSETTFLTSEQPGQAQLRSLGSVGSVLPYVTLKLDHGPAEQPRPIRVRTPYAFVGYLGQDGEIRSPLDDEGYLHTDDLGLLDANGQLVLRGRTGDFIKKGGYFVSLVEIEALATTCPGVLEAVAVATVSELYGDDYNLFIRCDGSMTEAPEAHFRQWMAERLVRYKWPCRIQVVEAFPRTESGKIQKRKLSVSEY
ncbi:AMP-dependent synthetase and ligase [Magnetococcus marinus MC-1]|uniref:AMP-dependent synthetase and ligase n=1 Tax=Magnetococcus marinus (strain ATCC BAA-1437 / JCM 17883 / MC-1) TaxID=156889 RepID=A0L6S9_MAGMM|nr:class I adenylate-forming enzyme family protein [Magnetococcus marinus]ABK43672.1 AMP-dependent synthetase and ligase [Magnetococcus marinus MC-1]